MIFSIYKLTPLIQEPFTVDLSFLTSMTKLPTLIDDLDFNNLDKYSSRSLVGWIKRDTGTQAQRELVKRTIDTRKQLVQDKIKDRIQINYRLSEDASNKLKQICTQVKISTNYKYETENGYEQIVIGMNTYKSKVITPQELVKAIVESNIEKLWSMTSD